MQNVLTTVAPVFGLIALGLFLARTRFLSDSAGDGLAEFVFKVAIPALLFQLAATVEAPQASPFALWGSYYGAAALVWLTAILVTRYLLRRSAFDGAAIAMAAAFSNIVMLGIPLALDRFGPQAAVPVALIVSVNAPLLWFAATLHAELASRRGSASWGKLLADLALSLAKNPIIVALLAGVAWRFTGLGLNPVVDKMITLLGDAAIPSALVALGLSLVNFQIKGQMATLAAILVLNLLLMPVLTGALAMFVFDLTPVWTSVAVLIAACPVGANAFLFASRYKAATSSVSSAVALGTALSAITISLVLAAIDVIIM